MDIGKDAKTVTNKKGAKQSETGINMDLVPAKAILRIGEVVHSGAKKYGRDNWRDLSLADNINHAITHLYAFLAGDKSDAHLSHAACRALFALEQYEEDPNQNLYFDEES